MRAVRARTGLTNYLSLQELRALLERLDDRQIPVVVLKGCALAATLYPDVSLRPLSDIDLLVPQWQFNPVRQVITARGYEPGIEMSEDFPLLFMNQEHFLCKDRFPPKVEIHRHVLGSPYYWSRAPVEWFWRRTVKFSVNNYVGQMLAPEAQLVHLSTHLVLQHRNRGLSWSYDIALLLQRYRNELNWEEVFQAAHAFGLVQALEIAIRDASELWRVPLCDEVVARFCTFQPDLKDRFAFGMTTANHRQVRNFATVLFTRGTHARLQFWIRKFFPSGAYMRDRFAVRHALLLPFYYVWRLLRGLINWT